MRESLSCLTDFYDVGNGTLSLRPAPHALHANQTIGAQNAPGVATQTNVGFHRRMDMRLLGGPIKSGHDNHWEANHPDRILPA